MFLRPRSVLSVLIPLLLIAGRADAEPAFCGAVRADLASLGSARSGNGLAEAQAAARQAGCYGRFFLFFGRSPSPACGAILARLSRLQRFAAPVGLRLGLFPIGPDQRRANLRQQLTQAGCAASSSTSAAAMRTLCVRKCDGFYFPINSAATRKRLSIDQRVCESMYPPGEAGLYTQKYSGQTDGEMTSLEGEAYSKQPFAYLYRSTYDPTCASSPRLARSAPLATPVVGTADVEPSPVPSSSPNRLAEVDTRAVRVVGPPTYYTLPDADLMAGHGSKLIRSVALTPSFALATREVDK